MKYVGILAVLVLVSGCLEVERYPAAWPARTSIAVGACPDVSGHFGFTDADAPRDFQSERALRILHELSGFQRLFPVPNRVEISQRQDQWLNIEVFVANASTRSREFTRQNAVIRCEAGGLFIKPPPLEQIIDGSAQTIRRELVFTTAADGSLVFREKYTATSRILVIPVAGYGIRWNHLGRIAP